MMRKAPRSVRPHVAILGKVNVGKSTLINALADQEVALVSDEPGTTTDPVYKSMELLPFGPVVLVDTAGLDDESVLGRRRGEMTGRVLRKSDAAVLLVEGEEPDSRERGVIEELKRRDVVYIVVRNVRGTLPETAEGILAVNALSREGVDRLKEALANLLETHHRERPLVSDLLCDEGIVLLVTPIDSSAPKGRLILPQVQVLRDILDGGYSAAVCRDTELSETLQALGNLPQLVITDSRVFGEVARVLPPGSPLTSFSILMARHKGEIDELIRGASAVEALEPGDSVLVSESCTHHRQKNDIGTVIIPRILRDRAGGDLQFTHTAGSDLPRDLEQFDLIVHCGGCMMTRKEMMSRLDQVVASGVPVVNYGILLAHAQGNLPRAIEPLRARVEKVAGSSCDPS